MRRFLLPLGPIVSVHLTALFRGQVHRTAALPRARARPGAATAASPSMPSDTATTRQIGPHGPPRHTPSKSSICNKTPKLGVMHPLGLPASSTVRRPTFALIALSCALACAVPAAGDQSPDSLRNQAAQARSREASLSADVARLGQAAGQLERQLTILENRRAQVQGDLAADRARLAQVQASLRAERARLTRLRARLKQVRATLAERLRAAYKAPQDDLTTVVVTSKSLADLLERARYLRDIEHQDKDIMLLVKAARADAAAQTRRLAADERRQHEAVVALHLRAKVLAGMSADVRQRRATLVRVRAARASALSATRANRARIESRLAAVERQLAAQAAAARATSAPAGGSGGWAIPAAIVMCESGGQNLPPNSAGASGYYQILPSTWKGAGGSGPAAYLASKAEQDRVAAQLWAGGAGASNWVCAGIVS